MKSTPPPQPSQPSQPSQPLPQYTYSPQHGPQAMGTPNQGIPVVNVIRFTDQPMRMTCPNCNNDVTSITSTSIGTMTWLAIGFLVLIGCWICCLVPLCIPAFHDIDHTCPVCNYRMGKYERLKN